MFTVSIHSRLVRLSGFKTTSRVGFVKIDLFLPGPVKSQPRQVVERDSFVFGRIPIPDFLIPKVETSTSAKNRKNRKQTFRIGLFLSGPGFFAETFEKCRFRFFDGFWFCIGVSNVAHFQTDDDDDVTRRQWRQLMNSRLLLLGLQIKMEILS